MVDGKGDGVRSRYVVQQFKRQMIADAFSGTPGLIVIRVLLAIILIEQTEVIPADFSVAFMRTPLGNEEVYVEPPRELVPDMSVVWELKKALNGLVKASQLFQTFLVGILTEKLGFVQCPAVPTFLRHNESGIRTAIHVDDPLATGKAETVANFYRALEGWLAVRVGGAFNELRATVYLGSRYWRTSAGFVEAPAQGYLEDTAELLGMGSSMPVQTPGVKDPRNYPNALQHVGPDRRSTYRAVAGKYQYVVERRADLLFALKECGRHLHEPRGV